MAERTRILIVEDHEEFRTSLNLLLNTSEDFTCTAVSTAEEALSVIEHDTPRMVLMDINLPGMSGIECSRHIKEKHPKVLIMMCTVYEDDEKIFSALKAGASGYILKRASIEEIFDSIKLLLAGGSPMSATIARKVVESFMEKKSAPADGEQLSERENEILDQLAMGLRIKEIADKLNISINTVRTHIRHIYEKLQVQTRVEALNKARKSKFL